jgi:choline kinase
MDLVVLAAGMGSRYGGLKQVDPVGPSGETLLDYGVYDALRAGFGRIVFVIRKDFAGVFREQVGSRYEGRAEISYAFQSLDDVPALPGGTASRLKPWGTGHAVWCARSAITAPFAVINADDFYGRDSFRQLANFLGRAPDAKRYALVGFRLGQTLSEHGKVSRGLVSVKNGRLAAIEERTGIEACDVGPGKALTGEETVSMNCWAFPREVLPRLGRAFEEFLARNGADPKAEFYLPTAISALVASGEAEVEILPTASRWFGITYREDKPRVEAALAELIKSGDYPADLRTR